MFTMKFMRKCIRTIKNTTFKDVVIFLIIVMYRSGKGIFRLVLKLIKAFGALLMTYLFSGSLIELAKETTISGFIEAIPEPTQVKISSQSFCKQN